MIYIWRNDTIRWGWCASSKFSRSQKNERFSSIWPFNKYKHNPKELAAQVLEEIPTQIMEYYTMNNIYPENLAKEQINVNQYNANNMNMNY